MGKRYNTLSDDIFRNSKYINALEQALEIDDFRKEYKEQYDIMLDVYKTLIAINNILFADSNKNKKEKTNEIIDTIEKVIYKSIDDDRAKYSTRTIKALIDSNTRLLYTKYSDWYEKLSYNDNYFDTFKSGVEEEMTRLENIDFDKVVKGSLLYEKNKNSNYKIYTSKIDYLFPNNGEIWKEYTQDFYDTYGITLNEQEINDIYFVYKLVAYANNGIVKLLYGYEISDIELTEKSNAEDFFKVYLKSLNIDIKENKRYMSKANIFLDELLITNNVIMEQLEHNIQNKHIIEIGKQETTAFVSNYDLYFFYVNMEKIKTGLYEFTIKTDFIVKIINDLKEVHSLMYDNVPIIMDEKQVQEAFGKVQNIIDRNKKMFERLS
jgi:hypothetical protein